MRTGAKVSRDVLILFPPPPLLCSPLSELLSLDEKLKEEEVDLRDDGGSGGGRRSEGGTSFSHFSFLASLPPPPPPPPLLLPATKKIAKCHDSEQRELEYIAQVRQGVHQMNSARDVQVVGSHQTSRRNFVSRLREMERGESEERASLKLCRAQGCLPVCLPAHPN